MDPYFWSECCRCGYGVLVACGSDFCSVFDNEKIIEPIKLVN